MEATVELVREISRARQLPEVVPDIYLSILRFIKKKRWQGSCHASTAIQFVLLNESGVSATPVIGEAAIGRNSFDHSWISINDEIFDAAIVYALDERFNYPPVYAGVDLRTLRPTDIQYGIHTGLEKDEPAKNVLISSISEVLDGGSEIHKGGLWGLAKKISRDCRVRLYRDELYEKYSEVTWKSAYE